MSTSSFPLPSGLETILPQTPLLDKAIKHAKTQSPDWLFGHVMRSWIYAQHIAIAEGVELHRETLGVAAVLHDLGLVNRYMSKDRRFEVDGADAAVKFLHENVPQTSSDNPDSIKLRELIVWDAIAIHTTPSIGQHTLPEIRICQRGITMDILGIGMEHIPGSAAFKEWVETLYPRGTIQDSLRNCLCSMIKLKPETTYDNVFAGIGEAYVEGYERSKDAEEKFALVLRPTDGHTS